MANLNKVLLMGNMTRNPQLSYLPSNTPVVEFGLAINRRYKKQDGTMADEPCYVDCRLFGKRAEVVNKYFKKGDPIFVEGRLQYDAWEKDGKKQSKLRVFVENFEFIGKGGQAAGASPAESSDYEQAPETSYGPAEDDIPF
ncbi:MAG TPA: single-stranded DNA-binding protein [Anaerohalosphaeraceae bacterium]|nr:single-stranded DNA-binding protein [Anaerohalosphaeraceae bacterium]